MKIFLDGKQALTHGGVIDLASAVRTVSALFGRTVLESDVELKCSTIAEVRSLRDKKLDSVIWRYERHSREERLGLELTDDIVTLDTYIQALADITVQSDEVGPDNIVWPLEFT